MEYMKKERNDPGTTYICTPGCCHGECMCVLYIPRVVDGPTRRPICEHGDERGCNWVEQ